MYKYHKKANNECSELNSEISTDNLDPYPSIIYGKNLFTSLQVRNNINMNRAFRLQAEFNGNVQLYNTSDSWQTTSIPDMIVYNIADWPTTNVWVHLIEIAREGIFILTQLHTGRITNLTELSFFSDSWTSVDMARVTFLGKIGTPYGPTGYLIRGSGQILPEFGKIYLGSISFTIAP